MYVNWVLWWSRRFTEKDEVSILCPPTARNTQILFDVCFYEMFNIKHLGFDAFKYNSLFESMVRIIFGEYFCYFSDFLMKYWLNKGFEQGWKLMLYDQLSQLSVLLYAKCKGASSLLGQGEKCSGWPRPGFLGG